MVTNPAAVVHEDGSVFLYYKAVAHDRARFAYGAAKADSSLGPGKERLRDDPIFGGTPDSPNYEDAFVWRQPDANGEVAYHMIFNDLHGHFTGEDHAGGYASSSDGITWQPQGKAYSRNLTWSDGTQTRQGSLEYSSCSLMVSRVIYLQ